jgi:hypothetical protein
MWARRAGLLSLDGGWGGRGRRTCGGLWTTPGDGHEWTGSRCPPPPGQSSQLATWAGAESSGGITAGVTTLGRGYSSARSPSGIVWRRARGLVSASSCSRRSRAAGSRGLVARRRAQGVVPRPTDADPVVGLLDQRQAWLEQGGGDPPRGVEGVEGVEVGAVLGGVETCLSKGGPDQGGGLLRNEAGGGLLGRPRA